MYLTAADFKTHIYAEIIDEITRADTTILPLAINTAIGIAKSYLNRFDTLQLFGSMDGVTAPTITDEMLKSKVKDITIWELINLGNVNIHYENALVRQESAIKFFKDIQKGVATPDGWPYLDTTTLPVPPSGDSVVFFSNQKRKNNF